MMSSQIKVAFWGLIALWVMLVIAATTQGAMALSLADLMAVFQSFGDEISQQQGNLALNRYVILELRLPRIVTACVVGAGLAAAGVCMQGLFRNPLADPSLIGVSSGASLGAVLVIVLGSSVVMSAWLQAFLLPLAAFFGGLIATLVVYGIATRHGNADIHRLLLAGIAINAMAGAGVGLLSYIATDNQLRDLTFWSMGSVAKAGWQELAVAAPVIVLASIQLMRYRKALDSLLMGEAIARQIGHDVLRIKRGIIICSTLIVGTAVSMSGVILFVGLVIPHLVRLALGPGHQHVLPLSMLAGACLMLVGDLIARTAVAPAELPIGLLMSLVGGPFFIALLLRQRL
ncbi:Hemin transport system permease protein HmuU [BD1-7 clade bacterium]|uniref:Hemin transport system permease protein HmuU n=1 Tax=BD1-7 clade bacterium TaxID=2029982 RepID=A0A5S9MYT1_9GAMM|nr:Hemin transport system permease protein HmuU [BD1-7 clade bacterium]CAA0082939.1 Hemin transport system permease protein HmuU [BD1-7 clade bacterium]